MILQGKDILVLKSDGTAVIGAAKSCQVEVTTETIEVSSPATGAWRTFITGRMGWSVSISHLVRSTDFPANLLGVGNQVQLRVTIGVTLGLPFDGFVDNVTVNQEQSLTRTPTAILWHQTLNKFVAEYNEQYYASWYNGSEYMNPNTDDMFHVTSTGRVYVYSASTLTAIGMFTGTGIITRSNISASVGTLATGSIKILGTGAISNS